MNPFVPTGVDYPPHIDIEPESSQHDIYTSYEGQQYFTSLTPQNFQPVQTAPTHILPHPQLQLHMPSQNIQPQPPNMPPFVPDFGSQINPNIGTNTPLTYDYHDPYTIEDQVNVPLSLSTYHNQPTESSVNQPLKAETEFNPIMGIDMYPPSDYNQTLDTQVWVSNQALTDIQPSFSTSTPITSFGSNLPNAITFSNDERNFELVVVQQPLRARMCGFGDKDRRPISPPPILQLSIRTKDGQEINPENVNVSFFVVLCDSWLEDGKTEANLVYHSLAVSQIDNLTGEISQTVKIRNMVGSSVASATKLYDAQGNLGIYFVFHDISFRSEGRFRLGFSFIDIGTSIFSENSVRDSQQVSIQPKPALKKVFTNPFTVYTAKQFPGVAQSTLLSQCFARQGVKIPIRKDTKPKQKSSERNQEYQYNIKSEENEEW
ncbi:hypothetical protein F4703DRAFT_1869020 [Phycomyces blakesleeanus]